MKVGRTQGSRDRPGAWPGLQGWAELGPEMLGCLLSSVLLHAKTVTSFTKSESHFAAFLQSMIILPLKKNNKTFSAMPTSNPGLEKAAIRDSKHSPTSQYRSIIPEEKKRVNPEFGASLGAL
jgi:hypothetical protein